MTLESALHILADDPRHSDEFKALYAESAVLVARINALYAMPDMTEAESREWVAGVERVREIAAAMKALCTEHREQSSQYDPRNGA